MKLDNLRTIDEMQSFLDGSQALAFAVASSKDERYRFVEKILRRFSYSRLKRHDKGVVLTITHISPFGWRHNRSTRSSP